MVIPIRYRDRSVWEVPMRLPLAFAVVVLGFAGPVGAADQVPTFDVRQSCRGGSDNPAALESCLKSEAEARTQLVAQWAQFPAAQRRGCIAEAGREMASYVELLTCLQIAGEAKALPKQQIDLGPLRKID